MSYNGPTGFKPIIVEAIVNHSKYGSHLKNFRDTGNKNLPMLYSFMINGGEIDNKSLELAKNINNKLFNKFITQKKKGLTGYEGIEDKYREIDDHDSKHILIMTILFNNAITFKDIVEIGGGYGNCIRLVNNIINYNNWIIIDLPHILEVQEYFLRNEINDISKISFIDGTNNNYNFSNKIIDLVIGTYSISELSWDYFINYMENVVKYSKYLYLGYNNNCPSPELIKIKLEYILTADFVIQSKFDYTEPQGAYVSYTLYKNNNIK